MKGNVWDETPERFVECREMPVERIRIVHMQRRRDLPRRSSSCSSECHAECRCNTERGAEDIPVAGGTVELGLLVDVYSESKQALTYVALHGSQENGPSRSAIERGTKA